MRGITQAPDVAATSVQKHYRTRKLGTIILALATLVLMIMFVELAISVHILAAFGLVSTLLIIQLGLASQMVIDVTCGEESIEIRRLKIFPPLRIAWKDIRDAKWNEGQELLIYLHKDPHPVHVETPRVAKLDGAGLLRTIRERAGLE